MEMIVTAMAHFNLYEKVLFVHLNITGRESDTTNDI